MLTTMIAVLFAFALGVLASGAVVRARPAGRSLLVATLLLPACLPGPAFAIAWVELLTLLPAADWLSTSRLGRATAITLLLLSAFSAAYAADNPWTHPWIFDYWTAMGWIDYK